MAPCRYAFIALAALVACARPPADSPQDTTLASAGDVSTRAAPSPALAGTGQHFAIDCFDVYAECPPVRGLPALSADGAYVAIADTGPEDARDEFVLTLRVLAVAPAAEHRALPILTHEDRISGLDAQTDELSEALRQAVQARIAAADQLLADQGFAALPYLGTVHQARPGQETAGLRAAFDGRELTIHDHGQVRWRRAIGDSVSFVLGDDTRCGPFPVAEIAVWADRASGVALARVVYTTSDICQIEDRILVWRT
jgi:hypothetical protein